MILNSNILCQINGISRSVEMSGAESSEEIEPLLSDVKMNHTGRGDGHYSTPNSFTFETKFVVLNFMSIASSESPSVRTPGTSSSSTSFSDFWRKSRKSPVKQHQFSQQDITHSVVDDTESSAVNDVHLGSIDSLQDSPDANVDKSGSSCSSGDIILSGQIPKESRFSLWKQSSLYHRTVSELTSDSGDRSYNSDADDELEDTSNASSVIGSKSNSHAEFLQVVSRLPTVYSESELESESAGAEISQTNFESDSDQNPFQNYSLGYDQSQIRDLCDGVNDSNDQISLQDNINTDEATALIQRNGKVLDRTQLKLDLQEQQRLFEPDMVKHSFQTKLEDEMTTLESEVEDAIKKQNMVFEAPILAPLTPQSEAARILAQIGDEVRDQYENQLNIAVANLFHNFCIETMTYEVFRSSANSIIDDTLPGWRQVALLLVYGQRVAMKAIEHGQKSLGHLVNYTTILLADLAADFIIRQGGWSSVMNYDPSQSSESPDSDTQGRASTTVVQNILQADIAHELMQPVPCRDTDSPAVSTVSWPLFLLSGAINGTSSTIVLSVGMAVLTLALTVAYFRR